MNTNPCPTFLGNQQIAIWTSDNDIVVEESCLNSTQVDHNQDYFLFDISDYSLSFDQSLSAMLIDNDRSTPSFYTNNMAYACFGATIASDLGFDYKEYDFNDIQYYETYVDTYANWYGEYWFWYLFDVMYDGAHYQYNEINDFYPVS